MSSSGDFISYAVVITNKDTDLAIESPSVQAVARNGDSEVLGTDRAGGFYILPKDHIIVSGLIALPDSYTSDGISMEFVLSSSGAANMSPSDYPGSNSFVVSNITAHRDELFPNVTGEITSSHTKTIDSVMLTAVIRLNGEIVETEYTFIDDLEPNVPMAFEIDLSGDLTDYDSMEVWAQNWS